MSQTVYDERVNERNQDLYDKLSGVTSYGYTAIVVVCVFIVILLIIFHSAKVTGPSGEFIDNCDDTLYNITYYPITGMILVTDPDSNNVFKGTMSLDGKINMIGVDKVLSGVYLNRANGEKCFHWNNGALWIQSK